jgi:hypothetical protein
MQDLTRRTLRTWAIAGVIYALAIASLAIIDIPWKTAAANVALLIYAALHGVAAPGLWQGKRWAWRLALIGGLLGLLAAVVVTTGLVSSWAYLRGVYGDFGRGASIAALLFASVALQALGLYPALLLRALLRREVRADMGAGKGLIGAVFGLLSLPLVMGLVVFLTYRLSPLAPVTQEGREQTVRHLRAALAGEERSELSALLGVPVGHGPLYVTLWRRGQEVVRVSREGRDLAEAVRRIGDALAALPEKTRIAQRNDQLKVDRLVALGQVASEWGPILALSVNPGLDGLRRCEGKRCRLLLPDDLVKRSLFGAAPLVPGIREIRFGLHTEPVLAELGQGSGRLERVRTESWVSFDDQVLPVLRGNTPTHGQGPSAWRNAAIEGGDFILRQIRRDGRFHYIYDPLTGRNPGGGAYSLPRHSGTVYALALIYGSTEQERFRQGAEKAIEWLGDQMPERCGDLEGTCVVRNDQAWLGSAALTVVGMLEYQRRTGDDRYADTVRRLVRFILEMQRPDGDFHHLYDLRRQRIDPEQRSMFYSEEASLALVMAHEVLGDQRYLDAAERALDYLTSRKYDFFLGRFIYGADHWTCIAAEEAWPRLQSPQYLEFCRGYAEFIGRIQYLPGEWNNPDFDGHYGFGALMVPQAPAAAGFTEAIISAYDLSRHHGRPDEALREQATLALDALTRDQIRLDNAWLMRSPGHARGGIRRSLVEQEIRIDFTQHAACALIRGSGSLGDEG